MIVVGGAVWISATSNSVAPHLKAYLTTAHAETITDGTVAIKPHGFASYRIVVPDGAIDVAVSGQFEVGSRTQNDIQTLLLSDGEFVTWQSGYATSTYYDSGRVAQGNVRAPLPAGAGTYYLIFNNKPSSLQKTLRVSAGLNYNTWLPDSVVQLKQKIVGWFE